MRSPFQVTADAARLFHRILFALTNGIWLLQLDDGGAGSTSDTLKAGGVPIEAVEDSRVIGTKRIDGLEAS